MLKKTGTAFLQCPQMEQYLIVNHRLLNSSVCGVATVVLIRVDVLNVPIWIPVIRQMSVFSLRVHYDMLITAFLLDSFVTTGGYNAPFSFLNVNSLRIVIQTHSIVLFAKVYIVVDIEQCYSNTF